MKKHTIAIIYGSDSDLCIMKEAIDFLQDCEVNIVTQIVSAHRTPHMMFEFAKNARQNNIDIIIAGAGGAAHLPGLLAALTPLPIIGVPIKTQTMSGLDSLYSIVQMPSGIPVATMAINGAKNAAIFALSILGINDKSFLDKVQQYKDGLQQSIYTKNAKLQELGVDEFLKLKLD